MLLNKAAKRARAVARQCEKIKGETVQAHIKIPVTIDRSPRASRPDARHTKQRRRPPVNDKVAFKRCSLNDAYQVTVNSSDLGLNPHFMSKGQEVYCRVDGVPVVFTVNRENGLTLITQTFPRRFELPDMSEPVFHFVSAVRVL